MIIDKILESTSVVSKYRKIRYECICLPQNKTLTFEIPIKESMNSKGLSWVSLKKKKKTTDFLPNSCNSVCVKSIYYG